jgi:hypothetical protein
MSRTITCRCGRPTDSVCGVCPRCIGKQAVASAARQGLPPTIEDEKVLRHLTRISAPLEPPPAT